MPWPRSDVAARPHQRIRLPAVEQPAVGACPTNFAEEWGTYDEAYCQSGDVWYRRSEFATPPFAVHVRVTDQGTDDMPRISIDARRRRRIVFERGGDIYGVYSDDDGNSWSTPALILTGGSHPEIWESPTGVRLIAAYVAGEIHAVREEPGGAVSTFTFQRWNGSSLVNLQVENDSFSFVQGWATDSPWILVARLLGSGAINRFQSDDEGATWTEIV